MGDIDANKENEMIDAPTMPVPKVGDYVELDNGRTEWLLPCDDWDKADFRFPNPIKEWRVKHAIACNVAVTGRSFQYRRGSYYVRARITWVGDGEPDTHTGGWLVSLTEEQIKRNRSIGV